MINKSWAELEVNCPIDISRIKNYSREFDSNIPNKINLDNLNDCKIAVLNARSNFDSMVSTLIQTLYDREILKNSEDKILYAWLIENISRFLKRLDDEEFNLIVKLDEPNEKSSVGISRIASYSKILVSASDNIIYESILKATNEYNNFKETDKIKKEPKIFLYILFQILQVTISVLGGLAREKSTTKKSTINSIPTSWQSLMTKEGSEAVKEGYKQDTGIDMNKVEEDLKSFNLEEEMDE